MPGSNAIVASMASIQNSSRIPNCMILGAFCCDVIIPKIVFESCERSGTQIRRRSVDDEGLRIASGREDGAVECVEEICLKL